MARPIGLVCDDHPCTAWGYEHKIRMRHRQTYAAVRPNFVRDEGYRSIEFADRFDQHDTINVAPKDTRRNQSFPLSGSTIGVETEKDQHTVHTDHELPVPFLGKANPIAAAV
jgi:hypothetical protein